MAIPDGTGGWCIGGDFTSMGGQIRNHIAYIRANGTLGDWDPNANDEVIALAIDGVQFTQNNAILCIMHTDSR